MTGVFWKVVCGVCRLPSWMPWRRDGRVNFVCDHCYRRPPGVRVLGAYLTGRA